VALGCEDGEIKIIDITTCEVAANFQTGSPVVSISFSENGIWLASVSKKSTSVSIWDLRKMVVVKELDSGSQEEGSVSAIRFDQSGHYLAVASANGVLVHAYDKPSKSWSQPFSRAVPAKDVIWGDDASTLSAITKEGKLVRFAKSPDAMNMS